MPTDKQNAGTQRTSGTVDCAVCGDSYHHMSTFAADGEVFPGDRICTGCVSRYLKTGEWHER